MITVDVEPAGRFTDTRGRWLLVAAPAGGRGPRTREYRRRQRARYTPGSPSVHAEPAVQTLIRLFLKGLAALVPIVLTVAILVWLAGMAEAGMGRLIRLVLPEDFYVPGMGLLAGVALVVIVGLLSQLWLFKRLFDLGEEVLNRMPLVKTVYRAIKDFIDYFGGDGKEPRKVVRVTHPELPITMLGFVTREDFRDLPFGGEDEIAVYFPMSYQIGGYTLFIPRDWAEPLDMGFEDAMRLILTAAISRRSGRAS